jgi:citrate lyase alpha subunit
MDDTGAPELEVLRREIADLYVRRSQGDLPQRSFQKEADQKIIELFRAIARTRMDKGENIELEHHVIAALTRLDQKVLRDSAQELRSLFATENRLVEVRTVADQERPPTCDAHDQLTVDELTYRQMMSISHRRLFRSGQLIVGLVIASIGLMGGFQLGIAGPALLLLGVAGIMQALCFPSRWVEVSGVSNSGKRITIRIQCVRKQSAKAIISLIKRRMQPGSHSGAETG